jgi:hypothetical protein
MRDAGAAASGRDGRTRRGKVALSAAARRARAWGRKVVGRVRGRGAGPHRKLWHNRDVGFRAGTFHRRTLNPFPADSVRTVQKFVLHDQFIASGLAGRVEAFIAGTPTQFLGLPWATLHFLPPPIVACMMSGVFGGRDGLEVCPGQPAPLVRFGGIALIGGGP